MSLMRPRRPLREAANGQPIKGGALAPACYGLPKGRRANGALRAPGKRPLAVQASALLLRSRWARPFLRTAD